MKEVKITYRLRFRQEIKGNYDEVLFKIGDLYVSENGDNKEFPKDHLLSWFKQGKITRTVGFGAQIHIDFPSAFDIIEITRITQTSEDAIGWNELASRLNVPNYIPFVEQ